MSGTLKEISIKRTDVFWIPPTDLMVKPGWNSRNFNDAENKSHIESLKMSIRAMGVLEPLTVFREDNNNYISDGHCRHQAVLELLAEGVEIKSVPVKTEGKATNEADAMLRQALDGKPKTALELRHIFKRLLEFGWTEEQIAERSGKGLQSVKMALDFNAAPIAIQKMVESGRVSATLASQVYKKEGATKATETLSNAVDSAIQDGKERATAAYIGASPVEPRKARLTQVAEIIEACELDEETFEGRTALIMNDSERTKLFRLLDI